MSYSHWIIILILIIHLCVYVPRNYNQELMIRLTGTEPPNWFIADNIKIYICDDGLCIAHIYDIYSGFTKCTLTSVGRANFKKILYNMYNNISVTYRITMTNVELKPLLVDICDISKLLFNTSLSILN